MIKHNQHQTKDWDKLRAMYTRVKISKTKQDKFITKVHRNMTETVSTITLESMTVIQLEATVARK